MYKIIPCILAIACLLPGCANKKTSQDDAQPVAKKVHKRSDEKKRRSLAQRINERNTPQKSMSDKTYEQLRTKLQEYTDLGNSYMALKYAEKMYAQCENLEEIADLLLTCADLCFMEKNYKKASLLYGDYVRLYPGIPQKSEYAWYKAIVCSEYQQSTTIDRDQTSTRETSILATNFLKNELFTTYKNDVEAILARCNQRIVDYEIGIVNFYFNRGSFKSAMKRLELLRKEMLPAFAASEPSILMHEIRIAQAQHDSTLLTAKVEELKKKFSTGIGVELMHSMPELSRLLADQGVIIAQADNSTSKQSAFVNRF